jgi:peptide deformylase
MIMRILKRTQFGNPILRTPARSLSKPDIFLPDIQGLIRDMRYTLEKKRYGVGLAAPQVGQSLALALIGMKPTPTRPNTPEVSLTLINPEIVSYIGKRTGQWEGCISGPNIYGKALRHSKLRLKWLDEKARSHVQDFDGLVAQVIQHEVDHLNGILFVDRVKDSKTYVTFSEYKKIRAAEKKKKKIKKGSK